MCEQPEDAQPVIHRQRDDAVARHGGAVVPRFGAVTGGEAAAIEVDEHRQPLLAALGRCPDVEKQTIFAHTARAEHHVGELPPLPRN